MMKNIIAACLIFGVASLPAHAVSVITNGGFESGDFTGWTAIDNGVAELVPWQVSPSGGGYFGTSAPHSGVFSALNGFDGDPGLEYELYQDVVVPAPAGGLVPVFTTNHRIVYDGFGIISTLDRVFEISIRNPGDNSVLQTLYSQSVTMNGAPFTDLGYAQHAFDLSGFAGQLVRVHFFEFIPESFTGPATIEIDSVILDLDVSPNLIPLPTASFAGVIGFGLISVLRRRRNG